MRRFFAAVKSWVIPPLSVPTVVALLVMAIPVPPETENMRLCAPDFNKEDLEMVTQMWRHVELSCDNPHLTASWDDHPHAPFGLIRDGRKEITVSTRAKDYSPHAPGLVLVHEVGHAHGFEHIPGPCWCEIMCATIHYEADECLTDQIRQGHH